MFKRLIYIGDDESKFNEALIGVLTVPAGPKYDEAGNCIHVRTFVRKVNQHPITGVVTCKDCDARLGWEMT
jgi:hypothetical protein